MYTQTFRVVACGELESYMTSTGKESQKRQLRLQELGGWMGNDDPSKRISNTIVGTMFGNLANCTFYPNEVVVASIRFAAREYQGQWYQETTVSDIARLKLN